MQASHSTDLVEAAWPAQTEAQRRNQPGTLRQWRRGWDHANTYLLHLVTAQAPWPVSA